MIDPQVEGLLYSRQQFISFYSKTSICTAKIKECLDREEGYEGEREGGRKNMRERGRERKR